MYVYMYMCMYVYVYAPLLKRLVSFRYHEYMYIM